MYLLSRVNSNKYETLVSQFWFNQFFSYIFILKFNNDDQKHISKENNEWQSAVAKIGYHRLTQWNETVSKMGCNALGLS